MTTRSLRRLVGPALLGLLVAGSRSSGQEIIIEDAPLVPQGFGGQVNFVQNNFALQDVNFEQWVYGGPGRTNVVRNEMESNLLLKVGELERTCKLTQTQKQKLILAGHGDIKHFLDKVADAYKVFEENRYNQAGMNLIIQETQPLAALLRNGLFNDDSIYARTIGTTLDANQSKTFRQAILDRRQFHHRSNVVFAVARLDQWICFTEEQRQKLTEVVLRETRPSKRSAGQYDITVVMFKIGKIDVEKLQPIFDESRWKALSQQLHQFWSMEQFLKTNGFLDNVDPDPMAAPSSGARPVPRSAPEVPSAPVRVFDAAIPKD